MCFLKDNFEQYYLLKWKSFILTDIDSKKTNSSSIPPDEGMAVYIM